MSIIIAWVFLAIAVFFGGLFVFSIKEEEFRFTEKAFVIFVSTLFASGVLFALGGS